MATFVQRGRLGGSYQRNGDFQRGRSAAPPPLPDPTQVQVVLGPLRRAATSGPLSRGTTLGPLRRSVELGPLRRD